MGPCQPEVGDFGIEDKGELMIAAECLAGSQGNYRSRASSVRDTRQWEEAEGAEHSPQPGWAQCQWSPGMTIPLPAQGSFSAYTLCSSENSSALVCALTALACIFWQKGHS